MEAMRFFAGRCRSSRQSYLSLFGLALLLLPAGGAGNPSAAYAAEGTGQRVYQVQHSVFGDIGTYTNQIETAGPTMTVKTTAHFKVSALGVSMHNEDAQRTEKWQGDRLVSFEGVTKKNGDVTEVKGQANDNNFVISSPAGTIRAPATIHPANPVSLKSLQSATMMRVDTGKVEQVKLSGGGETTVSVNGNSVKAREYEITGSTHYKIWINNEDVPVKFVVDDDSGEVTFTLKK